MASRRLFVARGVFYAIFLIFSPLGMEVEAAILAPPTGLSAISGNTETSLSWGRVSGASDYVVYRSKTGGGPYQFVGQTQVNGHADQGLGNGAAYYYVVTALNADGQSAYSPEVLAEPTASVLKAPSGIQVIPGNGEVSVTWKEVTSAVHYNIFRISPDGQYTLLAPPALGVSYTDRSVTNGVRYHYAVQTTSTNPGAYSFSGATSPSASLPEAPASLTTDSGSTWASLSWAGSTGADYYVVYRGDGIGGPYKFRGSVTGTHFEDLDLTDGTTYYFVVTAVNANGSSAFSPEAGTAASVLKKPHAAVISGWPKNEGATLDWLNAPGAISYEVFRRTTGAPSYIGTVTSSAFTDDNLTNGVTYYYSVRSRNASPVSEAPFSNEIAVTPGTSLPAPTNVTVFPGNTQVTVTWDPVIGARGYKIQVAESQGGPSIKGCSPFPEKTSCTLAGLTNGTEYFFRVKTNSPLSSDYTPDLSATLLADLPLTPGSLTRQSGNTQVSLKWEAVPNATGYKVFRRTPPTGWQHISGAPLSGTYYNDTGLVNGATYHYLVAGVNGYGTGAWTASRVSGEPTEYHALAPVNTTCIAGNTQATMTWDPVVGVKGYFIEVAETPGGPKVKSKSLYTGINGHPSDVQKSYTATDLTNGQDYYFRIRSNNPGRSMNTADIKVTPKVDLPLAPSSLSSTIGNRQASLTWPAVDSATGYKIFRRTRFPAHPAVQVGTVAGTLFTDTGLDNRIDYFYSVSAVSGSGAGSWTVTQKRVTPETNNAPAPDMISGFSGNTQVTVTWKPVVGATRYSVIVAESPGGPQYEGVSTSNGKPAATIPDLTNGQTYYARVRVTSPKGSAYSGEVGITPSQTLPMPPNGLRCAASGNTQATLTWSAEHDAVGYRVHRRMLTSAWSEFPVESPLTPVFTDTGLANGMDYYYVVSTVNSAGPGAWTSSEVKCSPVNDAPLMPTDVFAAPGYGQVLLMWNPVPGATRYLILGADVAGGPYTTMRYSNDPSYMHTDLNNGKPYFYRIQAQNAASKWSAYSDEVSATPSALDSDFDGIPDVWEIAYFGTLNVAHATSDYDNDKYTDLWEFRNQQNGLTDPSGRHYDPKKKNTPGGSGYDSLEADFWNLMLPAILSGSRNR